jgi:glycosyltransferase involved in cell wall biosynthesis
MSKDMGVHSARGNIVIFIDHDNILTHPTWLNAILAPFEDQTIVASQSLLTSRPGDSLFLQYVNEVGVEDPFAIPYSIVAQAQLHPSSFVKQKKWLRYTLDPRFPLFGGANGCAFRKSIFKTIGGYTRDVDVFASLSEQKAVVALVPGARIHHKTSATLSSYLYKKGVYFVRFMKQDMRAKQFNWVPPTLEGKCWFIGYVFLNLTLLMPFFWGLFKALTTARLHWLFHPLYVWLITAEYCILGLLRLPSLLAYSLRFSRYKKNIQS